MARKRRFKKAAKKVFSKIKTRRAASKQRQASAIKKTASIVKKTARSISTRAKSRIPKTTKRISSQVKTRVTPRRTAKASPVSTIRKPSLPAIALRSRIKQPKLKVTRRRIKPKQELRTRVQLVKKSFGPGRERKPLFERISETEKLLEKRKRSIEKQKGVASLLDKRRSRTERQITRLAVGKQLIQSAVGITQLPGAIKKVIQDPRSLKKLPKTVKDSVLQSIKETGQLAKTSPKAAVVKLGADLYLLKGSGKALSVSGKVTNTAARRLNPFLKRLDAEGKVIVKGVDKVKPGIDIRTVSATKKGVRIRTKKAPKVSRKIELQEGFVTGIQQTLPQQAKIAGSTLRVATTTQANRLVSFLNRKRLVRKPIPGEDQLSAATKKTLERFDDGKLKGKDVIKLEKKIQKEIGTSLLERSTYVDPTGKLRTSRLDPLMKDATISDIFSRRVTFKKDAKPQILLFENLRIQSFPKSLRGIEKKLKQGKKLNAGERASLVEWQVKKTGTGSAKPVGSTTYRGGIEPEVTVASGEIIKRGKKITTLDAEGRRIPIVTAKIVKATPETTKLMRKYKSGKITAKELKLLEKKLNKETGFKQKLSKPKVSGKGKGKSKAKVKSKGGSSKSRRDTAPKAKVSVKRAGKNIALTRTVKTLGRRKKRAKREDKRVPSRITKTRPKGRPSGRPIAKLVPSARPAARPTKKPTKKPVKRPAKTPAKKPVKKPVKVRKKVGRSKKKKKKKEKKELKAYNVWVKSKGKFVKVNNKPLSQINAKNRGTYLTDKTTAATFRIKAVAKPKKYGKITSKEKGYYNKKSSSLRRYRIEKGKRVPLKNKFIEKRGKRLDTKSEKKQINLAKFIKSKKLVNVRKRRKK